MSDEEYISDEEFLANLQNIDNEKLIQSLQNCGHDGYYNYLYYPIIEEIKRRLSSTSAMSERTAKVETYTDGQEELWSICECETDVRKSYNYCPKCGAKLEWREDE